LKRALRLDCTSYRMEDPVGRCDLEGVLVNLVNGSSSPRTSG
jgi:hypothetical protein